MLQDCSVSPSDGDNKAFKLMVQKDETCQPKEVRFVTPNVCSRTIWLRKLNEAKKFAPKGIAFTDVYGDEQPDEIEEGKSDVFDGLELELANESEGQGQEAPYVEVNLTEEEEMKEGAGVQIEPVELVESQEETMY